MERNRNRTKKREQTTLLKRPDKPYVEDVFTETDNQQTESKYFAYLRISVVQTAEQ